MNNTEKRVEIPITIRTYARTSDKYKEAMMQIDFTSYHLSALFWFVKTAVDGFDLLDLQTDQTLYDFHTFRGNVGLVCEMGAALSEQLTFYSNRFHRISETSEAEEITAEEEPPTAEVSNDDEPNGGTIDEIEGETLALALSGILNNPNLPTDIYNAVKRGLDDVYNELPFHASEELSALQDELQDSPEYLEKLIRFSEREKND